MPVRIYEIGERYHQLTVIERRDTGGTPLRCLCDCGNEIAVRHAASVPNGNTKSCGCRTDKNGENNPNWRGGKSSHPMYKKWQDMVGRCTRSTHHRWKDYGGRGITVCERWRNDFWAYVADLGDPPFAGATVDRRDNDAGYSPENCRWATNSEQMKNRRPTAYSAVIARNLAQVPITHCRRASHEYTAENTYVDKHGYRHCRICKRERGKK